MHPPAARPAPDHRGGRRGVGFFFREDRIPAPVLTAAKRYRLLGADGRPYESDRPGTLGGNRAARIYGRLDCRSAVGALSKGYARRRVFFAGPADAIAAGYRPCGHCLRDEYRVWKGGPRAGVAYPWRTAPSDREAR